jgi:hypothetical protein
VALKTFLVYLLGGFNHGIPVEADRSLRQQPAIDRGACPQRDCRLGQYDTFAVGGGAEIHEAADLPEDVLG